jgi:hypothetical protein
MERSKERLPSAQGMDELLALPVLIISFLFMLTYMAWTEGLLDPEHEHLKGIWPFIVVFGVGSILGIFFLLGRIADARWEEEKEE